MRDTVARLDGVTKRYGDTFALREISLDIGRGGVLALLGPNGAGKTTSVKLMLGLASPTTGTATLFGGDPPPHRCNVAGRESFGDASCS